jgi:hypothetical protein
MEALGEIQVRRLLLEDDSALYPLKMKKIT